MFYITIKCDNKCKKMNEYNFTIQHDKGTHRIKTFAPSLSSALERILNAEKCPERAIVKIKIKSK